MRETAGRAALGQGENKEGAAASDVEPDVEQADELLAEDAEPRRGRGAILPATDTVIRRHGDTVT